MSNSRRHILLLEGNRDVRTAFVGLFECLLDYALHVATSTSEALAMADRPVQARRLVALALRLGYGARETWITPLWLLVSLKPSALQAVADDICQEPK